MTADLALGLIEGPIAAMGCLASTVAALAGIWARMSEMQRLQQSIDWREDSWLYEAAVRWASEPRQESFAHPRDMELAAICYLVADRREIDPRAQALLLQLSILAGRSNGMLWAPRMAAYVLSDGESESQPERREVSEMEAAYIEAASKYLLTLGEKEGAEIEGRLN